MVLNKSIYISFALSQSPLTVHLSHLVLKGQCHEIFLPLVFFITTSLGPNRHAQKRFPILSNIRGVISIHNRLPGDEYTGELIRIS
jgi:hypothetical protein